MVWVFRAGCLSKFGGCRVRYAEARRRPIHSSEYTIHMLKLVSTIFALAAAAIALRRVMQAKQGTPPVRLHADGTAAKAKQTLENAKENVGDVAQLGKDKVRGESGR
jgi:hypothetical protein